MEQRVDLHDLRQSVALALEIVGDDKTIVAAEVCASWCETPTARIRYQSDPSISSIETLKPHTACGIGIVAVIEDRTGRRVGFGSEADDLLHDGIISALEKAKVNAVADPYGIALPTPPTPYPALPDYHDPDVATLSEETLLRLANEVLNGALSTLAGAECADDVEMSGEIHSRMEHVMVGHSDGLLAGETTTGVMATLQCRLLQAQGHGSGSCSATHLDGFTPYDAGADAAEQALQSRGGITLDAGLYPVIFGPSAVADLLQDLVLPALSLDILAAGGSPFADRVGQQIAGSLLTVIDDGRLPGLLGSRAVTAEGLPSGATTLVKAGRLQGFLADVYHARKLASRIGNVTPRNGRRVTANGQSFDMRPGIFPTNVMVSSDRAESLERLLEPLASAIYVDRLWYTCPQGGLRTGAFTSSVIGASAHIVDGKLAQPLCPGTLRIHDNYLDLLQRISGLSTARQTVASPCMQSSVLTPDVRCSQVRFAA